MGLPSTVWFVIAVIALALGAVLLFASRTREPGGGSERRRWAAMRGWEYIGDDPVLPSRWRFGTIHQGGPGVARDLISGDVPTPDGPRQAYVFDHEQAGRLSSVLVAVQVQAQLPAAVELWLADARLPSGMLTDDAGLDLIRDPVGSRFAFVSDAEAITPLLTPRLAEASDAVGADIELVWAEESWVLAAAPLDSSVERLQNLLADLAQVAVVLEEGQSARHRLEH